MRDPRRRNGAVPPLERGTPPAVLGPVDYAQKVAVVTGASSGIGYVTARAFAERGSIVVGVARREGLLQKLAAECRPHSPASGYLAGDLGDREFAERVIGDTVQRHGRIDFLVNNAAISKHKQFYHMTADEAEYVMRVNFLSCVWTTMAAIPHMLRQGGGSIVNISSFAAKVSPPRETMYAASKAAMNAFSEGLWNDLAGSNIHVSVINPGPIDTEIWLKEDEPVAYHGPKYPPEIVTDAIFVITTLPNADAAAELAKSLVNERLAACANLIPALRSIYRWQGKVQDENEVLVLFKTKQESYEALKARILELHPYEVPEVLAIPVEQGYQAYLDWLANETA